MPATKTVCAAFVVSVVCHVWVAPVSSDVVVTASGLNTFLPTEFFLVDAAAMPVGVSLTQISINLQGGSDTTSVWDPDQGIFTYGFKTGNGVAVGDVTFNPAIGSPTSTNVLDISILPGAMTTGDSFTFDFDTDGVITSGAEFGQFGVTVDFGFSNGAVANQLFVFSGGFTSTGTAPNSAIAEPGSLGSLLIGSLAILGYAWRRRRWGTRFVISRSMRRAGLA